MILKHVAGSKRLIASVMLVVMYLETVLPNYAFGAPVVIPVRVTPTRTPIPVSLLPAEKSSPAGLTNTSKAFIGGPTQPESQDFHSVNSDNMVDLFSGDFSYSIPLLDVGGYPLALGYNSGVGMDQDASWVGLGWNLNPGSITRNLRGLPDDFNGTDTIQQISAMKPNVSAGVSVALSEELLGLPLNKLTGSDSASLSLSLTASVGINYNNYKGWGMETGLSPSINVGSASMGKLTAGLSLTNSSSDGFTVGTSLDYRKNWERTKENGTMGGSVGLSTGFNSRSGMKALTLGMGASMSRSSTKNQTVHDEATNSDKVVTTTTNKWGNSPGASRTITSFAYPSYSPAVTLPYTNTNLTFTLKVGSDAMVSSSTLSFEGYYAKQEIKEADQHKSLPAYGYLNYQSAGNNSSVLMDYNREKDIPYREKPAVPNIGIPSYTYDVFAMSGEGTGGSFRAYRSDIGHVFDHYNKTKFNSGTAGLDLSAGGLVHAGATIGLTYAYTENGPWLKDNIFYTQTPFTSSQGTYEGAYFRNPGEMTVNDKEYYNKLGGDDVVTVKLNQSSTSSSTLQATKYLSRYQNKKWVADEEMDTLSSMKTKREKRNQVISYLTAEEASVAGFPKYIENYTENNYSLTPCPAVISDDVDGDGVGLLGQYYIHRNFEKKLYEKIDTVIYMPNQTVFNYDRPSDVTPLNTKWSARWTGRIKAPVTGDYTFYLDHDDGVRLFINDTSLIDRFGIVATLDSAKVNLVAGQYYKIRMDYNNNKGGMRATLEWKYPSQDRIRVPTENLYLTASKDTLMVDSVSIEKRVNSFRQKNHISEIDVTNADGKRYIYGLPVYNLQQKEATFSVDADKGNIDSGLVKYTPGTENSTSNASGNDHYFSSELMPAYAHTFLLTALLSPDYQDLTGNGITADDKGDAIKFNYTKIAGINNPYNWRSPAPAVPNQAYLNQGLRTDSRDDKGSYVYGQKELWYLHSIESKNMVAIFKMGSRDDLPAIDENGVRQKGNYGRRLEEINLYTKSELMKANPKPIKTVHFEYSYDLCKGANGRLNASGKLTLTKVWFTYNNNQKGKRHPYVFSYGGVNPDYNSKNVDRWGTYKSSAQNPSQINNSDYPYSLQDSTQAAQNAAAWTLDGIQLPSGGRIKVDYEGDDYAYVQNKRAAQMYTIAGFSLGVPNSTSDLESNLYNGLYDNQYVSINVPKAVSSNAEVYTRYLEGMEKIYFRLYVKMPSDKYGNGSEYVPCYATLDQSKYGFYNDGKTIYVRVKAISKDGEIDMATSLYSPLTKAAFSYLRMNLPSKAYPGSETGDNVTAVDVIKILASQASNIVQMLATFDNAARIKNWARSVDLNRSYVRLNNPYYKKYGGGIRVKRISIFDNWNEMTKQKESVYGQEYIYTTTKEINGKTDTISSGVATYEPMIGADENPWRTPLEYNQQVAALAPIVNGYTELPLGESFFPSPSVGYSKVRVRTINAKNTRSANGYGENCYYTSYDFPTLTDMTLLADNKKRYKPALSNLLRINAKHYIAVSQGFKVELNDMNGRLKSQASYSETNTTTPVTSTTNYYRVDDQQATTKHLSNTVMAMNPKGVIDTAAVIGKDMELMTDMREERSVSTAVTVQVNGDMFTFPWPPIMFIPMALSVYNKEETMYHSAAVSKVIYRHGILDSVVVTDKDSKVSTRNLLYDSETGNVILTSTQNEFNDPIYNFTMPAAWAYDGMSGAYKNIGATLKNIYIKQGRITSGLPASAKVTDYFAGGDKIMIYSKPKTGGEDCAPHVATFPATGLMYTVDANEQNGGTPDIYFVDENGQPFTGNDITLKIVKSGRKNIGASISNVALLTNPLVPTSNGYRLVIDSTSKVISAAAVQYKSTWKVPDSRKSGTVTTCVPEAYGAGGEGANCGVSQTTYGNHMLSRSYAVNSCTSGYIGKYSVSYIVPANKFTSTVSQADADAMAQKLMNDSGQVYANAHGVCIAYYTSAAQTATVTKTNCPAGTKGGTFSYSVGVGNAHSYASQAAADSIAYAFAYSQALSQATNSSCYYYSVAQSGTYTRNNCAAGTTGGSVTYTLAAGADSSTVSQAAADSLAKIRLAATGQAYANANGTCLYYNTAVSSTKTKNNCATGGTGSSVTYTVAAGKWSSTVSQAKADSLASADLATNAQTYANTNGSCTFYNTVASVTKTKNNCATGGTGSSVTYTVAAGKWSSTVSQASADSLATVDLTNNAQTYANTNGTCTFYNTAVSVTKTRNNCATGGTGGSVTYTVPANKYSSTVSQAQADSLANVDLTNNAQTYANTNGTCTFYNTLVSLTKNRNNCGTGGVGGAATYSVAAGKWSSTVSQAQADSLANVDLNANAQAFANINGTCTYSNTAISVTKTKNNCATGGNGSSVTYIVNAGKWTSNSSQAAADSLATVDLANNAQTYANNNGYCTFYNTAVSTTKTRSNCATGGTGSSVTYTVAASKYSSTVSQAAADSLAALDLTNNAQTYANTNGTCTFYNTAVSVTKTRNNCATGGTGGSVTYTVAAKKYSSTVSQAQADSLASADLTTNGQTYANTNGTCTFYNTAVSVTKTRNNCATGGTGGSVTYTVAASKYSSTVSQAQADSLASADLTTNGQTYANTNGTCTFYNTAVSTTKTRSNCATGGTGSSVTYTVAASKYSSTVSQAAADSLANVDLTNNAQTYANTNGTCTFYNTAVSVTKTRNNCATGGTGGSVTYTVAAKKYSSTVSQAQADSLASVDLTNNGQTYANTNGTCTFYNTAVSVTKTRNNCATGGTGGSVTYTVAASKYSSTVSQAQADSLASADLTTNGQTYANTNGTCTFYNTAVSTTKTRSNCATGGTGSSVTYTVAASKYSSTVSQAAADSLANVDLTNNAQTYANTNGTCTFYNTAVSVTKTRNNCATGGTGGSVTYTVAAKKYSSTVSQAQADSLASVDLTNNGQTYANTNGTCTFYNTAVSVTKTRNNCATGGTGGSVTYTVAAGKYSSTVSQAQADSLASADLTTNGQTYANTNGTCTFYNTAVSTTKTRNNCATGGTGSSVTYSVAASKYSSTVSQAQADSLANADLTANAQTYANTNGTCTFYNTAVSVTKTRANCATGGTGSSVTYTVAANKYSSTVSQAKADSLANADLTANGQTYANTNGTCTFYNAAVSSTKTRNNCGTNGTGSSVTYTVAAKKYSSTISQASADSLANVDITNNAQTYANTNGTCTYTNDAMSRTYTRNNCATGYVASSVTYTVAAGKYTSTVSLADANAKAAADTLANGQAYANTNGTCTQQTVTVNINPSPSGYTANTAHGNIQVKTASGTTICSGIFDGTDLLLTNGASKTYTTTESTFIVTIAAMTTAYGSVNGSAKNVYTAQQTWTVSGSVINILLYLK